MYGNLAINTCLVAALVNGYNTFLHNYGLKMNLYIVINVEFTTFFKMFSKKHLTKTYQKQITVNLIWTYNTCNVIFI